MWRRLTAPFKDFGWGAGTLYVVDRLLNKISPRHGLYVYEFMVQPIVDKALLPANLAKNLSFAEIGREDPAVQRMPARNEIKQARFDQGSRCLGAYRKGELIGFIWFDTQRHLEDEVRFTYDLTPTQTSVFDFDLYLFPEHRMGIGFMALWHGANAYLWQRGVRYTFSRLTRFNLASRRSHAHLGWKCVGRAAILQLGRCELMVATIAPYVGLTFSPRSRITLQLTPDVLEASSGGAERR